MNAIAGVYPHCTITTALVSKSDWSKYTLVIVGILLLTISAKVQIPLWPVPMTMQTYVVLVIGMAYGSRFGSLTVAAYLALGAIGLPVFAGTPERGVGVAYMFGPTGGYLLGFLVAAAVCGKLAERGWDRQVSSSIAAMTLGHALMLALGVLWLASQMPYESAVSVGLTPFLLGTLIKTILAALTLPIAWKWVRKQRFVNSAQNDS